MQTQDTTQTHLPVIAVSSTSLYQGTLQPAMCIYTTTSHDKLNTKTTYSNNIVDHIQSISSHSKSDINSFPNESHLLTTQPHILNPVQNSDLSQHIQQPDNQQVSKVSLNYSMQNQIQIPGAIYSAQNALHLPLQSTVQVPVNVYASHLNLQGKLPNTSSYNVSTNSAILNPVANTIQLPSQTIYAATPLQTNCSKSNVQSQIIQSIPVIQSQQQMPQAPQQFIISTVPFDNSTANNQLVSLESLSSDKTKKSTRKRPPKKSKLIENADNLIKQEVSNDSSNIVNSQPVVSTIVNKKIGSRTYADGSLHVCLECSKAFTHPKHLEAHKRQHLIKKTYSCSHCGRSFTIKGNLERHVRSHLGTKPFPCTQCNKEFSQSSHLKIHLRRHTGERPFICSICFKAFSSKGNLERHTRTHTGERPFVCSRCFMVFSQSSHLDSHMRTHSGLKPFKCEQCLQSFASRGNLDRHMKTHLGPKTYKCSKCSTVFEKYGQLHKHQQTGSCPGKVAASLAANLANVISLPISALSTPSSQSCDLSVNTPVFSISVPISKPDTQETGAMIMVDDSQSKQECLTLSSIHNVLSNAASSASFSQPLPLANEVPLSLSLPTSLQQSIASINNGHIFTITLPMSPTFVDHTKINQQLFSISECSQLAIQSDGIMSQSAETTGSQSVSEMNDGKEEDVQPDQCVINDNSHCSSHSLPHINVTLSMNGTSRSACIDMKRDSDIIVDSDS